MLLLLLLLLLSLLLLLLLLLLFLLLLLLLLLLGQLLQPPSSQRDVQAHADALAHRGAAPVEAASCKACLREAVPRDGTNLCHEEPHTI